MKSFWKEGEEGPGLRPVYCKTTVPKDIVIRVSDNQHGACERLLTTYMEDIYGRPIYS